jgi:hypothetical protein
MSIDYRVFGIKPADKKWKDMKRIYDSYVEAGLEVPNNIWEYFDHKTPEDSGVRVEVAHEVEHEKYRTCYTVDLTTLSPDIKTIVFEIS